MLIPIRRNRLLLSQVGVPVGFFLLDVLIRRGFGLSIADAGPDMALAATAASFALAMDEMGRRSDDLASIAWLLTFGLAIVWILVLLLGAETGGLTFGVVGSMVGLGCLLFFSMVYAEFVEERVE